MSRNQEKNEVALLQGYHTCICLISLYGHRPLVSFCHSIGYI